MQLVVIYLHHIWPAMCGLLVGDKRTPLDLSQIKTPGSLHPLTSHGHTAARPNLPDCLSSNANPADSCCTAAQTSTHNQQSFPGSFVPHMCNLPASQQQQQSTHRPPVQGDCEKKQVCVTRLGVEDGSLASGQGPLAQTASLIPRLHEWADHA